MAYLCSNSECDYGPITLVGPDHDVVEKRTRAEAYSQHEDSWKSGNPRYFGLCLNCHDDRCRDLEYGDYDF